MSHQNITWGHLGILKCGDCKAKCEEDEKCDGIQCVKFKDGSHSSFRFRRSLSVYRNKKSKVPVGISCQWLRKPRKSNACEPNDKYNTCWKKEDEDDGILDI